MGFAGSLSSSLVSLLFREAFFHLYISCFHLLVNVFSIIIIIIIPIVTNFPKICAFIIVFSFTVWTKMRPLLDH